MKRVARTTIRTLRLRAAKFIHIAKVKYDTNQRMCIEARRACLLFDEMMNQLSKEGFFGPDGQHDPRLEEVGRRGIGLNRVKVQRPRRRV